MKNTQRLQLAMLPFSRIGQRAWNTVSGKGHMPAKPYYATFNPTYRCNLKCVHCSLWDRPEGEEEMTLDEMKHVVDDLKKFLSLPALDILGGEAFLRPETMELIRYATAQGVFIKIVTNGTMLNEKLSRELIQLGVHKVCISIDGIKSGTHDTTRGVAGAFVRTLKGVQRLKHWRDELGGKTRIVVSTLVDASTLEEIPSILDWVVELGLDELHLVPLDQDVGGINYGANGYEFEDNWFERNPLWIRDIAKLEEIVGYVIARKREGYPVADPITFLEHMIPYFRDAGGIQHLRPCRAGSELMRITP
jgi:MoaA/NifB/PqqE/SkfB family radical SAM enzyme